MSCTRGGRERPRAPAGRGKRGGYSVIDYARRANRVIWLLTIYAKNVAENIPAHVLRQIRKEVADGEMEARRRTRDPQWTP